MIKTFLQRFLKAHWISLLVIAVLSACLKLALHYSFFLSYLILLVAYFLLGPIVEFAMEKIALSRHGGGRARERAVRPAGKTAGPATPAGSTASAKSAASAKSDASPERRETESPTLRRMTTDMRSIIDLSPDDPESQEDGSSRPDKRRMVLQKKNTDFADRPTDTSKLTKLEKGRTAFAGDDVDRADGTKRLDPMAFAENASAVYAQNTLRNRAAAETAAASVIDPSAGSGASESGTAESPASREIAADPVPQPDPVSQSDAILQAYAVAEESPDVTETARISEDITREVNRRIEEGSGSAVRRRRRFTSYDLESEARDLAPEAQSPEPEARNPQPETQNPQPEMQSDEPVPIFSSVADIPEISDMSDATDVSEPPETRRPADRVHADPQKIDDLFRSREETHEHGFSRLRRKNQAASEPAASESAASAPATLAPGAQGPGAPAQYAHESPEPAPVYQVPPISLLRAPRESGMRFAPVDAQTDPQARKLVETLASFGVGAKVVAVTRGPAVTLYELQPDPGVKVSRIVSLSDDIALSLAATGVRIEAPIPGKGAIGIEVPNKEVEIVYLRDVIESREYREAASKLTFAIGKDIAGRNIVADISKMPHLLIAGATGSGKSVCINTIIASLLYKATPEEVRMIMIDPKIVELGVYNGIPHLLVPVVTNPKKAAAALAWAVGEMEKRYNEFSQRNVRDIRSYNALCTRNRKLQPMPQVVIIIDELADLMMAAAKEIEDSIIRLAQKARAAGLHLIIATQRPSVDVITGLIKANIPSRIAFAVSSQVDSRTILDAVGAEKLLGRGDMLFHPMGSSKPIRLQGAFVSDGEIEALVAEIKRGCGTVSYNAEIQATMEAKETAQNAGGQNAGAGGAEDEDCDADVIQAAAELAFEFKQLSTSFVQRRLKLGYSRASRVVDALESSGLISAADGSKPRRLLMTREEWEARNT